MKKLLFLLFPILSIAQVGINTTNPTNTLDVNGTARVRSLTNGTTETNSNGEFLTVPYKAVCMGIVDANGNLIKGFGATVSPLTITKFRITFNTPQSDENYVVSVNGKLIKCSYNNTLNTSFDVILDNNPAGVPDFHFSFIVFKL